MTPNLLRQPSCPFRIFDRHTHTHTHTLPLRELLLLASVLRFQNHRALCSYPRLPPHSVGCSGPSRLGGGVTFISLNALEHSQLMGPRCSLNFLRFQAVGWFCSFCGASFPAASLPMWFRPGLHHLREHGPSGMEDPGRSWRPESHRRSAGKCHETPLHVHVTVPDSCFVPGGFYERRTTPKGTMSMKQESHAVASVNHSEHVATPVLGPCPSVSRGRECRY